MFVDRQVRILLIEDDLDLCQGWSDIFDLLGYEYFTHQNGRKALADEKAISRCNLVISDYYLPDLNGVELIRRLRAIRPELKAIVLTGSREPAVVSDVQQCRDCELLYKPLNIETLENAIAKILGLATT